jgi:hypothetical protein
LLLQPACTGSGNGAEHGSSPGNTGPNARGLFDAPSHGRKRPLPVLVEVMTRPNLPPQPPLSREQADQADQLSRFAVLTRQTIETAGEAIDLRKWCIEKAIQAEPLNCVEVAKDIHDFITHPLKTALDGLERTAKEKDR